MRRTREKQEKNKRKVRFTRLKKNLLVMVLALSAALFVGCESTNTSGEPQPEGVVSDNEVVESVSEDAAEEEEITTGENLFANGDFSSELNGWAVYNESDGQGSISVVDGEGVFELATLGTVQHANQLYYDGFSLLEGGVYELSFDARASIDRPIEVRVQLNGGDYHAYAGDIIDINGEMATYTISFTMEEQTDPAPRFCINMGMFDTFSTDEPQTIVFDNVSLVLVDGSNVVESVAAGEDMNINVNQIGYTCGATKTAIVRGYSVGQEFQVVAEDGSVVYTGSLADEVTSDLVGETVCKADFTDVKAEGTYYVVVGDEQSYSFKIGNDVYDDVTVAVVKYMYTQRCGMELTEEYAGAVAHGTCHTSEATIYGTNTKKDVSGGWHDAGDFGKYVVPGAQTAMDLMLCYEENPSMWSDDNIGIPESGNGVPDILDETRYELEFLLKMQDEATGGVYHKVTTKAFPGFIMPDEDMGELVLSPISTTATGDFAGVMAKAYVVYSPIDKDFANQCLAASKKAYDYMETNAGKGGFHNPSDISTGEYPDETDTDEMYFAAAMLYVATGEDKYMDKVDSILSSGVPMGYGWIEMGAYANMALIDKNDKIKDAIIAEADKFVENAKADGYDCSLGKDGYCWGSNLGVCNNARLLLWAAELTGDSKYSDLAYRQLDYLFGENSLSMCFVTGFGTKYPDDTHHRPSYAAGSTVPGMLVGGPNGNLEDAYVQNVCAGLPVAKCYADNQQSYSTNEVTIYWNSPLAVLLTELQK